MTNEQRLHEFLLLLHRWTGVGSALFLIIVGLTGSVLAFRSQIDRLLNPQLHAAVQPGRQPLDLATFAERAEAADPHCRPGYYSIEEDQVVMAMGARTDPATGKPYQLGYDHLIFDPWTGNALARLPMRGPGSWRTRVLPFVYDLHTSLATRTNTGWTIVGIVALIWTLDSFVGFYLTFPRGANRFWQRWRQAWKIKFGASAMRVNFDLHRAGGLWLWPLLFIFGWSSVMLGLPQVYAPVTKAFFDYRGFDDSMQQLTLPKPLETPKLDWRTAQAAGERIMAEQAVQHHFTIERPYGMAYIDIYGAYTYGVRSSLDLRGHGWDTTVLIDGNTGQMRSVDLPRGQHMGNTVSTLLWGIHYADLRDCLPYRIFICLFGLFLVMLSVTGVYIFWKKWRVRKVARTQRRSVERERCPATAS